MTTTFLFDILEERLKCMGPSSEGTVPFQIIHFLRFVWALVKSVFNEPIHQNSMLEYDHFFVSQQHSWDCGLACCNMILRWCGDGFSQQLTEDSVCSDERPLWTIELFHMLQSAGVEVEMYTKYRGVNPAHHKLRWYENAHDSELLRIQECFEQTEKEQLPVFERSISLEQLKSAAKDSNTAIILLLDVHTLLKRTNREDYSGHYIVLMNYVEHTDEFVCLNPASHSGAVHISADIVEDARTHAGTDEDLLICRRNTAFETPSDS